MINVNKKDILQERKEIENDILSLIKKTKSDATIDDVKHMIYEEEESDDMQDIIALFDDGDMENLSNVCEVITDAWNYFPHKALGGKCPYEMMSDSQFDDIKQIQKKGLPQLTERNV